MERYIAHRGLSMNALVFRRMLVLAAVLFALVILGTVGFVAFEGLTIADALYFTVVTISTVGYGDIYPSTMEGKVFSLALIIVGVGFFLGVVAEAVPMLLQRREERTRKERIGILMGVFFSEIGARLLRFFIDFDPEADLVCRQCLINDSWTAENFTQLRERLENHGYLIDPKRMELEPLRDLLKEESDLLIRLLENPNLQEHESFTDLLRTVFHLKEELALRPDSLSLPDTDLEHLANDIKRSYVLLVKQWIDYMHYLKSGYPYLFSLALRTNPFSRNVSPIVE
ncbi:potassium channel family protein [Chloroflexota bacterium]